MSTNCDRAIWARDAVQAFQDAKGEPDFTGLCGEDQADAISDLIADLGHLADRLEVSFVKLVEQAVGNWSAERRHLDDNHLDSDHVSIVINGEVQP